LTPGARKGERRRESSPSIPRGKRKKEGGKSHRPRIAYSYQKASRGGRKNKEGDNSERVSQKRKKMD